MNIELYVFRVREINVDIKSRKILIVITRALFFYLVTIFIENEIHVVH